MYLYRCGGFSRACIVVGCLCAIDCYIMSKGKAGIFAQIKRFIFVLAIMVGLMFLGGEGGGFMRFFVAGCCFVFAWGAWENWAAVRELEQEQVEDDYKF